MKLLTLLPDRVKFARLYYALAVLLLLVRAKDQLLLSQLQMPSLNLMGNDLTYIFFSYTGLSNFLIKHYTVSLLFDICLISSACISFLFPKQKTSSWVFSILLALYLVVSYTYLCFHKHNLIGLWVASLMFLSISEKGFSILFELVRMFCLFTYASSGFWKFYRGIWNESGHLAIILKNDALPYLVAYPNSLLSNIISFAIAHPAQLDVLMSLTSFLQLSYIIGFFTKRLDWFFFLFAISFHICALYMLSAYFMEFSTILITLLPIPFLYKSRQASTTNYHSI